MQTNVKKKYHGAVFGAFALLLVFAVALGLWGFSPMQASAETSYKDVTADYPNCVIKNNINDETTREGLKLEYYKATFSSKYDYRITVPLNSFVMPEGYELEIVVSNVSFWRPTYEHERGYLDSENNVIMLYPGSPMAPANMFNIGITFRYKLSVVEQPLPEEPTKEGYRFVGWYYGTEDECDGGCTAYESDKVTSDTNLHAHFAINKYTVTYNSMGGTVVADADVDWNTAAPLPETTLTGYNFVGWFKLDGIQYNGEPITDDTYLYAQWDVKIFTVTFYANGEVHATMDVPYGTTLVEAMEQAKIATFATYDVAGYRVSKMSTVTEDTQVFLHELTREEKFGDWLARNMWATWTAVAVACALAVTVGVAIAIAVKRG